MLVFRDEEIEEFVLVFLSDNVTGGTLLL